MRIRTGTAATLVLAFASGCGGGGGGSEAGVRDNRAPALDTVSFSVDEDAELAAQVTATDPESDTLTFTKTTDPAAGAVTSFASSGSFVYRPNSDFSGNDSFGIRVMDSAGNSVNGTVSVAIAPVNDPPVAVNDVLRVDGAALASINALANDRDADGDTLTVTVEEPAFAGSAAVNADGGIGISGLPASFRGLTRLRYRVTEPAGGFSVATAAIFVGTDPFRVAFAADEASNGSPEVYMTDFVSRAWRLTAATDGNLRLRGFAIAANGSTIAYRRESAVGTDLSFARTTTSDSTAAQQVRVALPSGYTLVADQLGNDQYTVSPDGQWIAAIAATATPSLGFGVFVLNVGDAANVRDVIPAGAVHAALPRFSSDSQALYFLAADQTDGTRKSLYRVALGAATAVLLSAPYAAGGANGGDIEEYSVSPDQARIMLQANRAGRVGIYFIDSALPMTEVRLSHALAANESIVGSTVGAPPGLGGSIDGRRVAYTVLRGLQSASAYVAEVGPVPSPRLVAASGARALAFRADDAALLFRV